MICSFVQIDFVLLRRLLPRSRWRTCVGEFVNFDRFFQVVAHIFVHNSDSEQDAMDRIHFCHSTLYEEASALLSSYVLNLLIFLVPVSPAHVLILFIVDFRYRKNECIESTKWCLCEACWPSTKEPRRRSNGKKPP